MKTFLFALLCVMFASDAIAATYGVTTPGQQTLTNRFLPYAGSGTQLIGNSPAWRDSAGVLGINNYLEGLETLTPGAAVNLNFSTWRTKRITLNQNTIFTAINIPSASTNVQTMLLEVIGDGAFTVSFANVTWQTPEITTPEASVVTLYALRGDNGAVKGYTQAITATGIGPLTSGYIPVANATNNITDSILFQVATNQLGFVTQDPFLTVDFALNSMGMGLHVLNEGLGIGVDNTGFGMASLYTIANGSFNSGFGFDALTSTLNGNSNSGLGQGALHDTTDGSRNIGLGARAGYTNTIGDSNIFIGYDANPVTNSDTNQIVIGTSAVGNGSNTTVIGNTNTVSAHILASGYAGTGANFLSDDGTYKAAGGGSALWSSSSGNLTPSPAVDVVSIQSQSADNATNAALIVDTDLPWTLGHLLKLKSATTNQFTVTPYGNIVAGAGTDAIFPTWDSLMFSHIYDEALGEPNFFDWVVGASPGGASKTNFAYVEIYGPNTGASLGVGAQIGSLKQTRIRLDTDFNPSATNGWNASIDGEIDNNFVYWLDPQGAFHSPIAYRFGTYLPKASGLLLAIGNDHATDTTNKVTIDWEGSVVANSYTAGATNLVGAVAAKQPLNSTLTTLSGKSTTGSGDIVLATSPTLVTPTLGVATATSLSTGYGTNTALAIAIGTSDTGIYNSGSTFRFQYGGTVGLFLGSTTLQIPSTSNFNINNDVFLTRDAAARFQQGADSAAVTSPQIFGTADGTGTDKAGATKILAAGRSTGTGRPGDLSLTTGSTTTTSGSGVNADSTRFYAVSKAVDLTGGAATAFQKFTMATNNYAGMEIVATVRASDAAFAMQSLTSVLKIDAVNVGGTNNVQITQVDNTLAQIPAGGTLTCTYDTIDEGGNVFSIRANAASSLTETILRVKWVITALNSSDAITVTPQ